jgi:hypothetical protein
MNRIILQGRIFPELFDKYFEAMSFYYSCAVLKKGKTDPEYAYLEVLSRIDEAPAIIKEKIDQFTYDFFLENWQSMYYLWQTNQIETLQETYRVNRFVSKILFHLIIGDEIFYNSDINLTHVVDQESYDVAWENIESILKEIGILV